MKTQYSPKDEFHYTSYHCKDEPAAVSLARVLLTTIISAFIIVAAGVITSYVLEWFK